MQHTDKYKFNIIEADDPFSPDALNENTQKVEDALVTHEAVVDSALKDQKLAWQAADKTEAAAREAADKTEAAAREAADKAETTARVAADEALNAAKAEKTALAAEAAALAALTARVGALEADKLIWKYGTYTGDGTFGKDHPTRLEFDFKPMALFVCYPDAHQHGGDWWLRPARFGRCYYDNGIVYTMALTWEDRAVQWYFPYSNANSAYQMSAKNSTYLYLALGVEE